MKTRLCIMATVPISIVSFYGRQLDYLTDNGFNITVITSPDQALVHTISPLCRVVLIPMTRRITPLADLVSLFRVAKVIKEGKFDIVQYSSPKAALLGSICAFFARVPVRLYLMWGIYYTGQAGLKRCFLKFIEKVICFFSTDVAPDSQGNYQFVREEGLCPVGKLSVVGNGSANGVDLERFNPTRLKSRGQALREHLNIPADSIVVGFVGRLCREKGIDELVGAFTELAKDNPKLRLLLVGPQENLRQINKDRLIIAGYQERPEEYLAAMDIFVLPSYREGFGIVNIEASAMELPVVSTDIPGPRDSVLNGKTGILVPVGSRVGLQEAIETLLKDSQLRHQMGQAGRQWARNFEQQRLWGKIVEHRRNLLQKSGVRI